MKERFKFVSDNCYICKTTLETTQHMFYGCVTFQNLWKSLHDLISSWSTNVGFWSFQNIQIGVIVKDKNTEFLVNNLIITTKYYIHKLWCAKSPPTWLVLKNEFSLLRKSLNLINKPQAIKLHKFLEECFSLCPLFKLYVLFIRPHF